MSFLKGFKKGIVINANESPINQEQVDRERVRVAVSKTEDAALLIAFVAGFTSLALVFNVSQSLYFEGELGVTMEYLKWSVTSLSLAAASSAFLVYSNIKKNSDLVGKSRRGYLSLLSPVSEDVTEEIKELAHDSNKGWKCYLERLDRPLIRLEADYIAQDLA